MCPANAKVFLPIIIIGFTVALSFHFIALAAIDAPHNDANSVSCGSCHGQGLLQSPFWGGSMSYDELCQYCHTALSCPISEITGPLVKTHSDSSEISLAECRTCHDPHYQKQKNYKNTDWSNLYLAYGTIESFIYNGDGTSTLTYSSIVYKIGWDDATRLTEKTWECRSTILFPNVKQLGYSYPIIAVDTPAVNTITVKGDVTKAYQYIAPPTDFAVLYGQFIRDSIDGSQIKFFDQTGKNSYADGDGSHNGMCEVCHTLTMYHRNNGTDARHFATSRCIPCHTHINSFLNSGGEGPSHSTHIDDEKGPHIECTDCHDRYNYPFFISGTDGNGDGKYNLTETDVCDNCHSPNGAFDGVDDAVIGAKNNWDNGVYQVDGTLTIGKERWCAGCHDDEPAYSRAEIIENVVDNPEADFYCTWDYFTGIPGQTYGTDCRYHAVGGSGGCTGTWVLNIPETGTYNIYATWNTNEYRATSVPYTINYTGGGGGTEIVWVNQRQNGGRWYLLGTYDFVAGTSGSVVISADDSTGGVWVMADAIKWEHPDYLLGTHAPNVIGDNLNYGYYVTGHNIDCLSCHDSSKNHIDHDARTYEVDEELNPYPHNSTLKVVNAYEDGYRLRNVGMLRPMEIPKEVQNKFDVLDPSNYALCIKCHGADVLSIERNPDGTPIYTNFYQAYWTYPSDPKAPDDIKQSHRYHLGMIGYPTDSDWDAIYGSGTQYGLAKNDSHLSCITCHNVHGSLSPVMIRHGELISTPHWDKTPGFDFCYLDGLDSRNCDIKTAYPDSVGGMMDYSGHVLVENGLCNACHYGSQAPWYRTPVEIEGSGNPVILDARALPPYIPNDGVTPTLLTATVVDPNGDIASVEIDLTSIGGNSNQLMYDDGTNGDVAAGDDIYSFSFSGTTASVGFKTLIVTATDNEVHTDTEAMKLYIHESGAYVVDNDDATFTTHNWYLWFGYPCNHVGKDFRYYTALTGPYSVTWEVPTDMPAGTYNVYALFPCGQSSYDDDVYYTINYSGGSSETAGPFDQTIDGWTLLGTYSFDAGTGSVVLSGDDSDTDGNVDADAIKWVP